MSYADAGCSVNMIIAAARRPCRIHFQFKFFLPDGRALSESEIDSLPAESETTWRFMGGSKTTLPASLMVHCLR